MIALCSFNWSYVNPTAPVHSSSRVSEVEKEKRQACFQLFPLPTGSLLLHLSLSLCVMSTFNLQPKLFFPKSHIVSNKQDKSISLVISLLSSDRPINLSLRNLRLGASKKKMALLKGKGNNGESCSISS